MSNENLVAVLESSIERIRSGRLSNEAQVKQAIIVPILRELGWDDTNPDEFVPEYSVEGWVDYALCNADGKPAVFIEAKSLGRAGEAGERQLFKYAYGQGVPLLILTDGDAWNFYLSMAEGVPAERCFYRAALTTTEKTAACAKRFDSFLRKERVLSKEARSAAEEFHFNNKEKQKASEAIPKVWRGLLENPDSELRMLILEGVENECGIIPEIDDLDSFLEKQLGDESENVAVNRQLPGQTKQPEQTASPESQQHTDIPPKSKIAGYIFNGKKHTTNTAIKTLVAIVKEFSSRDNTFMDSFAAETKGRKWRLVARNREDLYDDKSLINRSADLKNGWWLGTKIGTIDMRRKIKTACKVASVQFGSQLTLIER